MPTASYTAADVLAKLLTVDGSGSGIDADLFDGLNSTSYAKLASPIFTGTPTLPTGTIAVTQVTGDSSTKVATTAFTANSLVAKADQAYVDSNLALKANIASPTFTGTPTLPTGSIGVTQAVGDNSTKLATTAFVNGAVTQWAIFGGTPTFISSNVFTLVGNQTTTFEVGRRLEFVVSSGRVYGTILTSVFGTVTTITMVMDSSKVLDSGLTQVSYGLITASNTSLPPSLVSIGFKNKIIGGDFSLNPFQRGTSLSVSATNTGSYLADRFFTGITGAAVVTIAKTLDAPTALQAGIFTQHCLSSTVTTAVATPAITDGVNLGQRIEGYNALQFGFGQAGSRFITKQFWVKAAKVGIHSVSFRNSASTRSYIAEYTVNASNTWEFKSITIPVDTSGVWLYDSGVGVNTTWNLSAGSSLKTAPNIWTTGNFLASTNSVNELDVVGNTFKIALVQLEAGSIATSFESRSVSQELELCERYYLENSSGDGDATLFSGNVTSGSSYSAKHTFRTNMRATPTMTATNAAATNFPATSGTFGSGAKGFSESRVANATGPGVFQSFWTASAEI